MESFFSVANLKPPVLPVKRVFGLLFSAAVMSVLLWIACDTEIRKTDSQLGLTPQQAAGRRVYDQNCDRCHEPYSSREKKAGSVKGLFKRQFLPKSGLPVNDQQVGDIVRYGRNMMPGFGQVLSPQQADDLLAYLHTL
jgi:mono/diheme cytochrome c family protein